MNRRQLSTKIVAHLFLLRNKDAAYCCITEIFLDIRKMGQSHSDISDCCQLRTSSRTHVCTSDLFMRVEEDGNAEHVQVHVARNISFLDLIIFSLLHVACWRI